MCKLSANACMHEEHDEEQQQKQSMRTPFIQKPPAPAPVLRAKPTSNTLSLAFVEVRAIFGVALPMVLTGLLLYSRSMISMLFLGRLGRLPLAGGSLAIGFANITGYSVLSGLAMGMEPVCGQAFGAKKHGLLGVALQQTVLLLLAVSVPIAALWAGMERVLLLCGQDGDIAAAAQSYILFSIPDLFLQSLLHPLRIYLRSQSITVPLTYCAAAALALHLPSNYLFVSVLGLGMRGVAIAGVCTNFSLVVLTVAYVYLSGVYERTGELRLSAESFKGWRSLVGLAVPSCASVCLEWWWYEIMILLCGLLLDPKSTVAAMGVLIQTTSLIYIFPSALSVGVSTRVGNELGANRPDRARRAARVGVACGGALGVLALAFACGVRGVWARVFTSDARIGALTAVVMPVLGACELGNCPQTAGCGALRGSARPRAGANVNLGAFYAVGAPVTVGLAFWAELDFKGLWLGLLTAQFTCAILMLTVLGQTDWELQAQRAQQLTAGPHISDDGDCSILSPVTDGSKSTAKTDSLKFTMDDSPKSTALHNSLLFLPVIDSPKSTVLNDDSSLCSPTPDGRRSVAALDDSSQLTVIDDSRSAALDDHSLFWPVTNCLKSTISDDDSSLFLTIKIEQSDGLS